VSDDAPDQESKTEDPSLKRLEDARKKGDVVKSQEVTTWFMLLGASAIVAMMAPGMASGLAQTFRTLIANADQYEVGGPALGSFLWGLWSTLIIGALVPLVVLTLCAVVANLLQHRPLLSTEPITPKLSKISPLAGAKRLFSSEALVNFGKGLAKLGIVGAVIFFAVWPERDRLDTMMTADPLVILEIVQSLGIKVLISSLLAVTVIAGADYAYQRNKWWKRQKMTLQEVKDEFKQMEGDPKIKGRIRQLRMEKSRQRMMAAVPDATVVVMNPTHYAVALKYDRTMPAPLCVAKGVDAVALRIRATAEDARVPVIENPPLARALYASVEIDETIPAEHFKAVAQVIGYVMRLKEKRSWRGSEPRN